MHRFPALMRVLGAGVVLAAMAGATSVAVAQSPSDEIPIMRPLHTSKAAKSSSSFGTAVAGTLYVGYKSSSADPQGVGVGTGDPGDGLWDFDTDTGGTDSSQSWKAVAIAFASDATADRYPFPADRPFWYFNWGNEANNGNTGLWLSREAAGRQYNRTGAVTIWHVDDMTGVSSTIAGAGSAWCGLRAPGDLTEIDPVTGSALNGDLQYEWNFGGAGSWSAYPGYSNQWDQILYRDVTIVGDGTDALSFDYRTDMALDIPTELNGTGWFNPDPTAPGNLVTAAADITDRLIVWVGEAEEVSVYDTNRRWLSEVLDFEAVPAPTQLAFKDGVGSGNTGALLIPAGYGTSVRIALQVKTNRTHSDETFFLHGTNSVDGAAVVDDIILNAANIGSFNADGDIKARFIHDGVGGGTTNNATDQWIATGRPAENLGHVHNAYSLPYAEDPCGALGSGTRLCTLDNNIVTTGDHDDVDALPHGYGLIGKERHMGMISPTIDFTGPRAAAQGTAQILSEGKDLFRVEYDLHTGTMDLEQAVFWNIGAAYNNPVTVQGADDAVQGWSPQLVFPAIFFNPDPGCIFFNTDTDLDPYVPVPSTQDSLRLHFWTQTRCKRFATSGCSGPNAGQPEGGYFDNIRGVFTTGGGAAITVALWHVFQDTFPTNEGDFAVGSADFDTTTAQVRSALNNAPSNDVGAGVSPGDSSIINAAFGTDTRLDLVFRILPGPGNYTIAGDMTSGLIEKDGGHAFWATYLAAPGPVGAGDHFGGTEWDPNTWNSARMDSADNGNIAALVSRQLGIPVQDQWVAYLHESDPNYATLSISKNRCFLVDPTGVVSDANVCCSMAQCTGPPFADTWPPAAYPAEDWASTTTLEGTRILPSGYFSPGAHIEYFYRRSDASDPLANTAMAPDTSVASNQAALGPHSDGQRFMEFGVFPDRWKNASYGGDGDACMLVVDAGDRRGQEQTIRVALDKLGYGKDNGAGQGWRQPSLAVPLDQDNPANHVSPNLGQKGLLFDWYDNGASESAEAGRMGCRVPTNNPAYPCYQGPSQLMLEQSYSTVLWFADDLETGVLHDGAASQEQSKDVALLDNFLLGAGLGTERAAWIAADGAANDLNASGDGGASLALLTVTFGSEFVAEAYRDASANTANPAVYDPVAAGFHPAGEYGHNNFCQLFPDVILVSASGAADGAVDAALYEDAGHRGLTINPGTYVASVYKPADPGAGQHFATLFSGHQVPSILGDAPASAANVYGRTTFMFDALNAFGLCVASGAPVQVGNTPGMNVNFVRGAFPNPSTVGRATINYSLAQPAKVTIRFYNVAGRLVHEVEDDGVAGPNTVTWDGATSTGMRASAGVYFYRLSAPGITFQNNSQRMVLLGANN